MLRFWKFLIAHVRSKCHSIWKVSKFFNIFEHLTESFQPRSVKRAGKEVEFVRKIIDKKRLQEHRAEDRRGRTQKNNSELNPLWLRPIWRIGPLKFSSRERPVLTWFLSSNFDEQSLRNEEEAPARRSDTARSQIKLRPRFHRQR